MNNAIPNVTRELLADLLGNDHDKRIMAERNLLAMLANAPSPAGVDGLEVVAWQQRYIDPDEGVSVWGHADARSASILKGRSDYELRPLYAVPPDAKAIIDGLRGEVADLRSMLATVSKADLRVRTERDQQAQRIGELEGLLRESYEDGEYFMEEGLLERIDAALSAGKEGE